jgi:hypothetical protein
MYRSVSLNGKAIIQAIIFSTLRRKNKVVYIHVSETFWHTYANYRNKKSKFCMGLSVQDFISRFSTTCRSISFLFAHFVPIFLNIKQSEIFLWLAVQDERLRIFHVFLQRYLEERWCDGRKILAVIVYRLYRIRTIFFWPPYRSTDLNI